MQGLAEKDFTGYFNTLGFKVPCYSDSVDLSLFYTRFGDKKYIAPIVFYLSEKSSLKFFTSQNILPGIFRMMY